MSTDFITSSIDFKFNAYDDKTDLHVCGTPIVYITHTNNSVSKGVWKITSVRSATSAWDLFDANLFRISEGIAVEGFPTYSRATLGLQPAISGKLASVLRFGIPLSLTMNFAFVGGAVAKLLVNLSATLQNKPCPP